MKRIVIFASGSGSNAENIVEFFKHDEDARVVLILTNNPDAFVVQRAEKLGVHCRVFDRNVLSSSNGLVTILSDYAIDCIVLAGFLWKFPKHVLDCFDGPVLNIHPALLPKYGGKGMYGMHVHRAVVENKESETGITIHHVNEFYDDGAIVFQAKCQVENNDSAEDIAHKIHDLEMRYFPQVIKDVLMGNG